jgi:type VI secretion system protein ImpF
MNEQLNLTASVLDRLLDSDPLENPGSGQHPVITKRQIMDSVIRDVENLLNTRCSPVELTGQQKHLENSLVKYGLQDFTAENPKSGIARQKLCNEIQKTLSFFEPRLKQVMVRVEKSSHTDRQVVFRISGVLIVKPLSEQVSFDTYLDLNRGHYNVA